MRRKKLFDDTIFIFLVLKQDYFTSIVYKYCKENYRMLGVGSLHGDFDIIQIICHRIIGIMNNKKNVLSCIYFLCSNATIVFDLRGLDVRKFCSSLMF